jgi:hypothetical protein
MSFASSRERCRRYPAIEARAAMADPTWSRVRVAEFGSGTERPGRGVVRFESVVRFGWSATPQGAGDRARLFPRGLTRGGAGDRRDRYPDHGGPLGPSNRPCGSSTRVLSGHIVTARLGNRRHPSGAAE